jgi:hypothetical protein
MRKLLITLFILVLSIVCIAAVPSYTPEKPETIITETLQLTANGTGTFHSGVAGTVLYQVDIITSADDTVTFAIYSSLGGTMYTLTTAAGTTGEIELTENYAVPYDKSGGSYTRLPTYALTNMASGSATIAVTWIAKF